MDVLRDDEWFLRTLVQDVVKAGGSRQVVAAAFAAAVRLRRECSPQLTEVSSPLVDLEVRDSLAAVEPALRAQLSSTLSSGHNAHSAKGMIRNGIPSPQRGPPLDGDLPELSLRRIVPLGASLRPAGPSAPST